MEDGNQDFPVWELVKQLGMGLVAILWSGVL